MTVLSERRVALRERRLQRPDHHHAARIADRAHELRSCRAAADEAGVHVELVLKWIKDGLSKYPGLPGQKLPPQAAAELRDDVHAADSLRDAVRGVE